jgi:hypothetical protein
MGGVEFVGMWPPETVDGDSQLNSPGGYRPVRAAEKPGIITTVKSLVQQAPGMARVPKMQEHFSAETR